MNKFVKSLITVLLLFSAINIVQGQDASGTAIRGKVTDADNEGLIGVNVVEIDANKRIISMGVTDVNGNFSMRVKNTANSLRFSYIGYEQRLIRVGSQTVFNVKLSSSDKSTLQTVEIKARRTTNTGTMDIPTREITGAMQKISAKDFEGLSVPGVDDALQGRVAGLDIVTSGDVGRAATMRIRGITSINASSEPLIVLNGVIYDVPTTNFDFTTANQEQFATLLSVNVDDIESITVLKDAATTAVWGSRGANGVISIVTKRGVMGKTRVQYSYRFSGAAQPQGRKMLRGDDYTMLMKEEYFNPAQNDAASNIREFNYDKNFSEYENYNNNTNWVKAVSQFGTTHDHFIQLTGGGERARFIVSGGYYNQQGTVIGQEMKRYTARVNLEYNVSDRIRFSTDFSLTNTRNKWNYGNLLDIAYKLMPNMSVYAQDKDGNNTDRYYKMLPDASGAFDGEKNQKDLTNPVALANLGVNRGDLLRVLPVFRLRYDLLDPRNQTLQFNTYVSFDVNNENNYKFMPKELKSAVWTNEGINVGETSDKNYLSINTDNNLKWSPRFESKDHALMLYASYQLGWSTSRGQFIKSYGAPNGLISPTAGGYVSEFSTGQGEGRWMAYMLMGHYVFKDRYIFDLTVRRDGSTKFGNDRKWGTFPGVAFGWNIADEPFMEKTRKWLSTFKFRPSWGISGNQPDAESLYYSLYRQYGSYLGTVTIRPDNIQLASLRWEKSNSFNIGLDLGFLEDAYTMDFNYYYKRTEDMLFKDVGIPASSGFDKFGYVNAGTMDNYGWELNLQANKIIKIGDFSTTVSLNFSNYINKIIALRGNILESYNQNFNYDNGSYLTRIQVYNAFGSIYGFRYKGVYMYNDYAPGREGTSPFALDADGNVVRDALDKPLPMTFGAGRSKDDDGYKFKGGDAIYEDVNHDGTINEYDIVYLGNSNPLFNGGFNIKFNYRNFSANIFSNFRVGNKIINKAKMHAENMYGNDNQSARVNWRWRKDGDDTMMPRALKGAGYNWLGSDRYVEDGTFLRIKNIQVSYSFDKNLIKKYRLSDLNFYLTINNLMTFTNYSGVDPEVGYSNDAREKGLSVDNSQTPRSKSFTIGVTIGI